MTSCFFKTYLINRKKKCGLSIEISMNYQHIVMRKLLVWELEHPGFVLIFATNFYVIMRKSISIPNLQSLQL